jgi:hypothetical protein
MSRKSIVNLALVAMWAQASFASAAQSPQHAEAAREDRAGTRVIAAGPAYGAGAWRRFLLGDGYRSLWTAPIEVPVLDLKKFSGGLTPRKRGGGKQTQSLSFLTFECAARREWKFRSIDKDLSPVLGADLQGTFIDALVQDQVGSAHPLGPLIVDPLARAVGILGVTHRLVVLPDVDHLGPFREEFGGTLGFLEEKARAEDPVTPGFENFHKLLETVALWERLDAHPEEKVDAPAFLRARLFDLLINDFDRHKDQWRWARRQGSQLWEPVPEDRDQAFVRYSGLALSLIRPSQPRLVNFGPTYASVHGLTWQGRFLDRRHLSELEWPGWQSEVRRIQDAITDTTIDEAVGSLPKEYRRIDDGKLAAELKSRRRLLPEVAREFYDQLAADVEIHGSDKPERVAISALPGSFVRVTLTRDTGAPIFQRDFDPRETRMVRLYLKGGDDDVVREVGTQGLDIRVVGGGGDDRLDDSAAGTTRFYDESGDNRLVSGPQTFEDRRSYTQPVDASGNPERDWGRQVLSIPWVSAGGDLGVFMGAKIGSTSYGFRRSPYSRKQVVGVGFSTGLGAFRAEYDGEFRRENRSSWFRLHARASELDLIRFYGIGNETRSAFPESFFEIRQRQFSISPEYHLAYSQIDLAVGAIVQYTKEPLMTGYAATKRPYGFGGFGKVGPRLEVEIGGGARGDGESRPARLRVGGSFFPRVWSVTDSFGEIHGEAGGVLRGSLPLTPTLVLSAGGKRVFGRYPFQEAAFLGGSDSLRGLRPQRYAGDASVYASAELRLRLGRVRLLLPSDVGVFGLADAGRVFARGEISDLWHSGVGGGVWIAVLKPGNTVRIAFARSEGVTRYYLRTGLGF